MLAFKNRRADSIKKKLVNVLTIQEEIFFEASNVYSGRSFKNAIKTLFGDLNFQSGYSCRNISNNRLQQLRKFKNQYV